MVEQRRRVNLSVDPDLYSVLEKGAERAGGVTVPEYVVRLLRRIVRHEGQGELQLRPTAQVQVDLGPLVEPLRDLRALELEILRAVYETRDYLHAVAPGKNHHPTVVEARDSAQRGVIRWLGRNDDGQGEAK